MVLAKLAEVQDFLDGKLLVFLDEAAEKDDAAFGVPIIDDAGEIGAYSCPQLEETVSYGLGIGRT